MRLVRSGFLLFAIKTLSSGLVLLKSMTCTLFSEQFVTETF